MIFSNANSTDFIFLEKEIQEIGIDRKVIYKKGKKFKGFLGVKTVKNKLEGGIIEFIPEIILAYDKKDITLNYEDYIMNAAGEVYKVLDNQKFKEVPKTSSINVVQTRLSLIKHFCNDII